MWKAIVEFLIKIISILSPLYLSKKWGEAKKEKELAEKNAKEAQNDAEISSKPYVDDPLGRMRRKK